MPRCSTCNKSFSRDDHLRRHEASHGFPRFACQHHGCGMRFHRQDVLRRHRKVHSLDPRKRRRRPRRGVLPRITDGTSHNTDVNVGDSGLGALSPVNDGSGLAEGLLPTDTPEISQEMDCSAFGSGSLMSAFDTRSRPCADDWLTPQSVFSQPGSFPALDSYDFSYDLELGMSGALTQPVANPGVERAEGLTTELPTQSLWGLQSSQRDPQAYRTLDEASVPGGNTAFRRCIAAYQARCLPLLPMLPIQKIQSRSLPMELMYAMAALGAQYVPEYEQLANTYFSRAVECLQVTKITSRLRLVQTRVLLVEYAAWKTSRQMQQWSVKEREVAKDTLLDIINQQKHGGGCHRSSCDGTPEETLRTAFAFYVQSVNLAICFGYTIPVTAQSIPFNLPCDDPVWVQAAQGLDGTPLESRRRRLPFRKVLHELLTNNTAELPCLLSLSSFAKDILICAVLETIINTASNPLSYATFEDYESRNLPAIRTRGSLLGALQTCEMLWPGRLHDYWDILSPSHPELEGALMVRLAMVQLNRAGDFQCEGACPRQAAATATEVFCSIAKSGFHEVRKNSNSLGVRSRHCAMECARAMVKWLDTIVGATPDERDAELLGDIRDALMLNDMGNALVTGAGCASGVDVQDALFDTWSELFGSRHWATHGRDVVVCC